MSNSIGKRGESIFSTIISRNISRYGFLFDPVFLGDKFPSIDFYVECLNYNDIKCFFFASVKTTTLGYNQSGAMLRTPPINKYEIDKLLKFQVPVYIFGIDEGFEIGYFICGNVLDSATISKGMPTRHLVDEENIERLWKEVIRFWQKNKKRTKFDSQFK